MLPDEMEAEKNRKMILAQADEIEILKRNVRELEEQLRDARKSNAKLIQQHFDVARQLESAQIHNKNLTQSLQNAYADISRLAQENNYLKERCNFSDVESHYMDNSIIVTREEV
tara:strand:- start:62 stop:403 length:342 start_codon:yes stop_codon:yes gene_type:complete